MKYFDKEKMGQIRDELEKEILQWPEVSSREMMGCLCYLHGKKMIAVLVTDGIVKSKLSEQDQTDLPQLSRKVPFRRGGKTSRTPLWQLKTGRNLLAIGALLKQAY